MADPYADIAAALSNRRQRFYQEQPALQAALSMQPIVTRRSQNQTKGAIAGGLQGLAKALMGAYGINKAQSQQAAYDQDFTKMIQSEDPIGAMSADPRFAEVGSLLANQQYQAGRELQNKVTEKQKLGEIDLKNSFIMKMIETDPKTRSRFRLAALETAKRAGLATPGEEAGISIEPAINPGSPDEKEIYQLSQKLQDEFGLSPSDSFTQAKNMVSGRGDRITGVSQRIEKSLPGAQLADVQNTWKTLLAHKDVDTRAGDIAIIQAFARMNDPGSTVREGEFAIAQSAAPIFQKYMAEIESTIYGTGRLTPQTRKEMIESAALKIGAFQDSYNKFTENQMQGLQGYPEDRLKTVAPFPVVDPKSYRQQIAGQQPAQAPQAQPAAQPQANMPQMPAPNPQAVQQLMQAAPVQQGESFEQYRARIMGGGQ